jgi:hypothetical protein
MCTPVHMSLRYTGGFLCTPVHSAQVSLGTGAIVSICLLGSFST